MARKAAVLSHWRRPLAEATAVKSAITMAEVAERMHRLARTLADEERTAASASGRQEAPCSVRPSTPFESIGSAERRPDDLITSSDDDSEYEVRVRGGGGGGGGRGGGGGGGKYNGGGGGGVLRTAAAEHTTFGLVDASRSDSTRVAARRLESLTLVASLNDDSTRTRCSRDSDSDLTREFSDSRLDWTRTREYSSFKQYY